MSVWLWGGQLLRQVCGGVRVQTTGIALAALHWGKHQHGFSGKFEGKIKLNRRWGVFFDRDKVEVEKVDGSNLCYCVTRLGSLALVCGPSVWRDLSSVVIKRLNMALQSFNLPQDRTLNVNQQELYSFFTNDTNAFNNIISIGGQVILLGSFLRYPNFMSSSSTLAWIIHCLVLTKVTKTSKYIFSCKNIYRCVKDRENNLYHQRTYLSNG